jgi:hypothetical protein
LFAKSCKVIALVVRLTVFPAAEQDANPFVSQGSDRCVVPALDLFDLPAAMVLIELTKRIGLFAAQLFEARPIARA